ncbi:hypothetical protein Ctaglu_22640 [Clostridium tagluense]|uniref:Uncharacterized protein n=1 Tax=Clostridium tagluense TaxID=360422 RepID=A0A401UMA5_9CLOT|nr:hypothetical protein Ctaglu_22640 [Clostridium tagluense]
MPEVEAFPIPSAVLFLLEPLEEQEASYFAELDNISSFLITSTFNTSQTFVLILSYFAQDWNTYLLEKVIKSSPGSLK